MLLCYDSIRTIFMFSPRPLDYLAPMLVPADLHDLLETSDVVGNIRFSHPTLYVFPGGQGDAALFGINGFNMLGKLGREEFLACPVIGLEKKVKGSIGCIN